MSNEVITATKKEYNNTVKAIKKELNSCENSFKRTALMLYWLDETQAYGYGEYLNGVEMAKKEFNLSKSTYYNFINIVKDFGDINPDTGLCDNLKSEYASYTSTQLIAMHGCTETELKSINSNMTIKEIKAVINALRNSAIEEKEEIEESENDIENDEKETDSNKVDTSTPITENSQFMFSIKNVEELENKKDEIFSMIRKTLEQGEQYSVAINMLW